MSLALTRMAMGSAALAAVIAMPSSTSLASGPASDPTARVQGYVSSLAAISPDDVWAVGELQPTGEPFQVLVRHWDGSAWSDVPAAQEEGEFDSVGGSSSDQVWFGGYSYNEHGEPTTLMEHWDGTSISSVALDPQTGPQPIVGISAYSSSDVWIVGGGGIGTGASSIVEHWNGKRWRVVHTTAVGGHHTFTAVKALSPTDVWVVGYIGDYQKTLAEHWDGTSWTKTATVDPDNDQNSFIGLSATSPDDIWAVGQTGGSAGGEGGGGHGQRLPVQSLTEHWDGTSWSWVVDRSRKSHLNSAAFDGAGTTWAVGVKGPYYGGSGLTQRWDGAAWTRVPSPQPRRAGYDLDLLAVAAAVPDDAWAAGFSERDNYSTTYPWLEHWDGARWHRVP